MMILLVETNREIAQRPKENKNRIGFKPSRKGVKQEYSTGSHQVLTITPLSGDYSAAHALYLNGTS